jgi:hypothetical protein
MSKFDKIFEAREETSAKEQSPKTRAKTEAAEKKKNVKTEHPQPVKAKTISANDDSNQRQRGRPKAKRSDPDFIGFTTYIRKETHKNVKIALLQEGNGRELSELVEELLAQWIKQ